MARYSGGLGTNKRCVYIGNSVSGQRSCHVAMLLTAPC